MFYTHDGGVIWHRDRPAELAVLASTSSAIHEGEISQPVRVLGSDLDVDGLEEMSPEDLVELDVNSQPLPATDRTRRSSTASSARSPMPEARRAEPERTNATEGRTYDQFGFPLDPSGPTRLAGFGVVRTFALGTSLTQIIGPSQQRVALLFSPPMTFGQSYTVSTEPGASLGAGLNVSSTTGPLRLTEEVFGDAVKRPWFAVASSAFSIGVLETIVNDKP